jgi:hypothetical protein
MAPASKAQGQQGQQGQQSRKAAKAKAAASDSDEDLPGRESDPLAGEWGRNGMSCLATGKRCRCTRRTST